MRRPPRSTLFPCTSLFSSHAQVLRVTVGEGPTGHERGDHRGTGEFDELGQLRGGLRLKDATADVEHRPAGGGDHRGGLADLQIGRAHVLTPVTPNISYAAF